MRCKTRRGCHSHDVFPRHDGPNRNLSMVAPRQARCVDQKPSKQHLFPLRPKSEEGHDWAIWFVMAFAHFNRWPLTPPCWIETDVLF